MNQCEAPLPDSTITCVDINKIRKIVIEELDYGYVVKVGCMSFAIATKDELIYQLNGYLSNPDETERRIASMVAYGGKISFK